MEIFWFQKCKIKVQNGSFQIKIDIFKTSEWNQYVFGWMSHPTYVPSPSLQAKWYVIIFI